MSYTHQIYQCHITIILKIVNQNCLIKDKIIKNIKLFKVGCLLKYNSLQILPFSAKPSPLLSTKPLIMATVIHFCQLRHSNAI